MIKQNPCSKCGISGLHACTGQKLKQITAEKLKELKDAIIKIGRIRQGGAE